MSGHIWIIINCHTTTKHPAFGRFFWCHAYTLIFKFKLWRKKAHTDKVTIRYPVITIPCSKPVKFLIINYSKNSCQTFFAHLQYTHILFISIKYRGIRPEFWYKATIIAKFWSHFEELNKFNRSQIWKIRYSKAGIDLLELKEIDTSVWLRDKKDVSN